MAFEIKQNTTLGINSVIEDTTGLIPTSNNAISLYDYATEKQPELIPEMHYNNGKGSITGLITMLGRDKTFKSDYIQWSEFDRLSGKSKNVVFTAPDTFTCTAPHNLRPDVLVKMSDGATNSQGYVTTIVSPTVFKALSDEDAGFNFAATVDIQLDFSSRFDKGTKSFVKGREWSPKFKKNYRHIIKESFVAAESDAFQAVWVQTNSGPRWIDFNLENTKQVFRNNVEFTQFFHKRAGANAPSTLAGKERGMKGVIQLIEEGGNITNEYIQTLADMQNFALRIKQQSKNTSYAVYCDHVQMNYFNAICAQLSPNIGYGTFPNAEEMVVKLDFQKMYVSGIWFYFTPWLLLDDPSSLGTGKLKTTGISYLAFPLGMTKAKVDNVEVSVPYMTIYYRGDGSQIRKEKTTILGMDGTPQEEDTKKVILLTETTVQLAGANACWVGRIKPNFYI